MSVLGAMNTAVSGLSAQSAAFGNISENISNSQTTGFKGVNTSFVDYLTSSTPTNNLSGSVVALPQYTNNVQGTITQSTNPLAMAISGQGFFSVAESNGATPSGQTTFNPQQFYTRAGDFAMNSQGYLVNSAGEYLQGWAVNPATGAVNQSQLQTIQVNQTQFSPVPTSTISLAANLPETPAAGSTAASQVQVYDALGNLQPVTVSWTQDSTNVWTATVTSPNNTPSATIGTAQVDFGPTASGNPVPAGTIGALGATTGAVTVTPYAAGAPASLNLTANFGSGNQTIALNLGNFGSSAGVTQFGGTTYNLLDASQNGVGVGAFSGISIQPSGNVVANYDNGQSVTLAQIPVTTFAAPNSLQSQNGQAYTATATSGNPIAQGANNNGAGTLVVGSVESSNVDLAKQFSNLIIAQNAYGANAKVITTASTLLQTAINMVQ